MARRIVRVLEATVYRCRASDDATILDFLLLLLLCFVVYIRLLHGSQNLQLTDKIFLMLRSDDHVLRN